MAGHFWGSSRQGSWVFSILLITLMGGALLPVVGHFVTGMFLWFALSLALAMGYVRTAYVYRHRLAAQTGETIDVLATLSDIAHNVLAPLGGGFFGVLCGSLGWDEYRKTVTIEPYMPLMAGIAVVGLGACVTSLVKFGRYMRTEAWRASLINTPP